MHNETDTLDENISMTKESLVAALRQAQHRHWHHCIVCGALADEGKCTRPKGYGGIACPMREVMAE